MQPRFDFNYNADDKSKNHPKEKKPRLTLDKNQTRNMEETTSFQDDTSNESNEKDEEMYEIENNVDNGEENLGKTEALKM